MALPDRTSINLATEDVTISIEEIDELVEESEAESRSELIRDLLLEELDDADGESS